MEQATDKQISFAKKLGIENPDKYDKQALRGLIDVKLAEQGPKSVQEQPQSQPKTGFDKSSYYVAYAKDLLIAMMENNTDKDSFDLVEASKLSQQIIGGFRNAFK